MHVDVPIHCQVVMTTQPPGLDAIRTPPPPVFPMLRKPNPVPERPPPRTYGLTIRYNSADGIQLAIIYRPSETNVRQNLASPALIQTGSKDSGKQSKAAGSAALLCDALFFRSLGIAWRVLRVRQGYLRAATVAAGVPGLYCEALDVTTGAPSQSKGIGFPGNTHVRIWRHPLTQPPIKPT